MKININTYVKVVLTEQGAKALNANRLKFNIKTNYIKGDIYKTMLWDLGNDFPFNIGFDCLYFENNEIELDV